MRPSSGSGWGALEESECTKPGELEASDCLYNRFNYTQPGNYGCPPSYFVTGFRRSDNRCQHWNCLESLKCCRTKRRIGTVDCLLIRKFLTTFDCWSLCLTDVWYDPIHLLPSVKITSFNGWIEVPKDHYIVGFKLKCDTRLDCMTNIIYSLDTLIRMFCACTQKKMESFSVFDFYYSKHKITYDEPNRNANDVCVAFLLRL